MYTLIDIKKKLMWLVNMNYTCIKSEACESSRTNFISCVYVDIKVYVNGIRG